MKHQGPISGVATFETRWVATAGYDNQVILWDAATRNAIARATHDHLANQCAFSRSGRWLVSASSDYSARVWEVPAMRMRALLAGHEDDVEMAAFSPDEARVATCSRDRTVRVHGIDGKPLAVLKGHDDDVLSVAWSADGRELITSSDDGTVRRWDVERGVETGRIDLGGVQTDTIVMAADGTIFCGDDLGRVSIVAGGSTRQVRAHDAGVKRLVWDEASRRLASVSYDRSLAIWHVPERGEPVLRSRSPIDPVVWPRSAAFLGNDKLLFATFGGQYHEYRLDAMAWADLTITPTPCVNAVAEHGGHRYAVGDAGIVWRDGAPWRQLGSLCNFLLPCGPLVLTGGQLGRVFDAVSGRVLHQHRSPLNCGATFRRDGVLHAAIGTYTGEAIVLRIDADGAASLVATLPLHANAIKGLAAADGVLFSVCASGAVAFHRLTSGECLAHHERGHARIANGCVAIDGGFASVGRDMKLRIWRDFRQTLEVDTPHRNSIKCVSADRDGKLVATGSYGGTVAVFDTVGGRWSECRRPTAAGISSLFGTAGGAHRFLASSYDGNVYAA